MLKFTLDGEGLETVAGFLIMGEEIDAGTSPFNGRSETQGILSAGTNDEAMPTGREEGRTSPREDSQGAAEGEEALPGAGGEEAIWLKKVQYLGGLLGETCS